MTRHQPSVDEMTFANQILAAADVRAGRIVGGLLPGERYGIVTAVDTVNKLATVDLPGSGAASPGFPYGTATPQVGDRVRVVIQPPARGGDRYVDEIYGASSEGTAFPAQPAYGNNRPFYRTDRGLWYYYDSIRWVCTCLHVATVSRPGVVFTAGENLVGRIPHPGRAAGWSVYITRLAWTMKFVGATNDATNRWLCRFYSLDGATETLADSQETDAEGASAGHKTVWRVHATPYADTYEGFDMRIAEQGAPSDIENAGASIEYRFIG